MQEALQKIQTALEARNVAEAAALSAEALAREPENPAFLFWGGTAAFQAGAFVDAATRFSKLAQLFPNKASPAVNAGMAFKALGEMEKAEAFYKKAIASGEEAFLAQAHFNYSNLLLQQGRYKEGFAEFEWRLKLPGAMPAPWPAPTFHLGLPRGASVLLWNEQGMGDALQFLRFVPRLSALGFRVSTLLQPALQQVAGMVAGVEHPYSPLDAPATFDAQLPLCSLPHVLGITENDVAPAPYIKPPQSNAFLGAKNGKRRMGLVWAGKPNYAADATRSMRFDDVVPLLDIEGIEWFSLQFGPARDQLLQSPHQDKVADVTPRLKNFADTAALFIELDGLVTVDTAPAHLAGAMGLPTFVFLPPPAYSDWRWGLAGDSSLWYSSMRLFRQKTVGSWTETVQHMRTVLS